jgi:hypothetical protein
LPSMDHFQSVTGLVSYSASHSYGCYRHIFT